MIQSARFKILGRLNSLKSRDSHQPWDLSSGDTDSRTGHKATDSGGGDEFHEPPEPEQTNPKDDEATNKSECRCNLWSFPLIRVGCLNMFDDLGDCERHNGDRPDRNILGGREELQQ